MRHNTSLSYRADGRFSLGLFIRFLIVVIFLFIISASSLQVYSQDKAGGATTPVSGTTENVKKTDNAVPGEGFVEEDFKPKPEEESAAWMIIKTIFVLGLFIGGFYMFYKFISQKAGLNASGQDAVNILSTVSLGPNRTIQIIDVAGKVFLLGVTESNINLLTEIRERDDIDRIRLLSSRSTPVQGATFQEFLAGHIGWVVDKINDKRGRGFKKTAGRGNDTEHEFDMSYLDRQKNRLKSMNGEDDE